VLTSAESKSASRTGPSRNSSTFGLPLSVCTCKPAGKSSAVRCRIKAPCSSMSTGYTLHTGDSCGLNNAAMPHRRWISPCQLGNCFSGYSFQLVVLNVWGIISPLRIVEFGRDVYRVVGSGDPAREPTREPARLESRLLERRISSPTVSPALRNISTIRRYSHNLPWPRAGRA
jgi:hypothetical protein